MISPGASNACSTILFDVDVPLVTKNTWSAPKARAAFSYATFQAPARANKHTRPPDKAYPLTQYSMYGAVPLRTIKKALLDLKAEGRLDRARLLVLTNCTFDGHIYNTERVMEECLAIKPDLIFLWDEAWFGFARWSPFYRRRTAMGAAAILEKKFKDPEYRAAYQAQAVAFGSDLDPSDEALLDMRLLANPDKVRL